VRLNDRSLLDRIALALLDEAPMHGFGVARAIEADDALAATLSVRRPLVYRSLDNLLADGLIEEARVEDGRRGAPRTIYRTTRRGKRACATWLDEVVASPRDTRLELLAKFALRSRRGSPNADLAARQRRHFEPIAEAMHAELGPLTSGRALVARWRYESIRSMLGVLEEIEGTASSTRDGCV
jgi:DNA-binding PadR family transcriptional regulator